MTKHILSYNDKTIEGFHKKPDKKKRVYHLFKMTYPLFLLFFSTLRQYHSPWGRHLFPVSRPF